MSWENVAVVRGAVERFNRGDDESAMFDDLYDAAAAWHSREDEPDTGVFHGREAIKGMARMWRDMFQEFRFEVEDLGLSEQDAHPNS